MSEPKQSHSAEPFSVWIPVEKSTGQVDKFADFIFDDEVDETSKRLLPTWEYREFKVVEVAQLESAKKAQGWVSVEDRLPEEDGFSSRQFLIVVSGRVRTCEDFMGGCFVDRDRDGDLGPKVDGVTHWRELPEPPKLRELTSKNGKAAE